METNNFIMFYKVVYTTRTGRKAVGGFRFEADAIMFAALKRAREFARDINIVPYMERREGATCLVLDTSEAVRDS